MPDKTQPTLSAPIREAHGVVTTTSGGRLTQLDADAPARRVDAGNGRSCELSGGGQSIYYNAAQGRVAIQRDGAVVAILNPRTAIGVTVDGRSGMVEVASDSHAAQLLAVRLNEGFDRDDVRAVAGVSGDVAQVGRAMQDVGLRCTDKQGNVLGPVLTPQAAAALADKAVKGR